MQETQNSDYNPTKRVQGNDVYTTQRPSQSFAEQIVSAHLLASYASSTDVRPPIFNIGRTPPRFGYTHEVPTILDIFQVEDTYAAPFGDWSGNAGQGYSGTSYPSLPQL